MILQLSRPLRRRPSWIEALLAAVLAVWIAGSFSPITRPIPAVSPASHLAIAAQAAKAPTARPFWARMRIQHALSRATPSSHPTLYHVRWGDTLWTIAQHFHVSLTALLRANRLDNSFVLAGTTLRIPATLPIRQTRGGQPRAPIVSSQDLVVSPRAGINQPFAAPQAPASTVPGSARPKTRIWPNPYHLSPADLQLIARLVQAEAGDQPYVAQVSVAAVVLNRLRTPGFPHTVAGVIFAPGQFEGISSVAFQRAANPVALVAARAAAAGWDPTGGALYFYNPNLAHAAWMNGLPRIARIGSQIFCR